MSNYINSFDLKAVIEAHDNMLSLLAPSNVACKPITLNDCKTTTCIWDNHHDIVYIHKTNCPNCGGLLDGDEHKPYVRCQCCGTKVWSEREVS